MAISDNQKIDYLFKKLGLGATKTDTVFNKLAANESIPSPLLMRGDTIWSSSGEIPNVRPTDTTTIVQVRTAIETTEDVTATGNRTWKTGITDWIPTEFGSTYLVNVYIHTSGDAAGAESMANKVFTTGSGNNDEWFFDYQSGVLNFIGDNLPDGKSFAGKSVFISGATYKGPKGVASASGQQADVSSLQAQIDNILSNTDPATLDSLSEIVDAFQNADGTFATTSQLNAQSTELRSDLTIGGLLDLGISDGTNGQVLLTDGSGNFSFGDNSINTAPIPSAQEFVGDGTTVSYILTDAPENVESVDVYVNDVLQRPSIFGITGTTLTFNETPALSDDIYVKYRYPFATMTTPINDSVQNQHLNLTYTSNQYEGDNSATEYTIQAGHSVHSVLVIVDGAIVPPTTYSILNTVLTFNTAPTSLAVVDIRYLPV